MNAPRARGSAISGLLTAQLGVILLAVLVGCSNPAEPVKGDASTDASRSLPTHPGRDGATGEQSPRAPRAGLLGICANPPSLDTGSLDRLDVDAPDHPEESRTLYLYPDAGEARSRFGLVRSWLGSCESTEEWGTTDLRPSRLGDQSLLEVTTDVGTGAGPTGRWLRLVRVGNALLLTDTVESMTLGPAMERRMERQRADLLPVLDDMEVFATRG